MSRFVHPLDSQYNINGIPLDGAKREFFEPGTLVQKDTFSDEALTVPNANPVIASASGTFPEIWLNGNYDVTLKDKNDVLINGPLKVSSFATSAGEFDTVAEMVASASHSLGGLIRVDNYSLTIPSGIMFFKVVAAGTGTADGGEFIDLPNSTPALQARQNFSTQRTTAEQWGAPSDGTDSLTEITAALATGRKIILPSNRTFDVSDELLIESFNSLEMEANCTIRGAKSPAVRMKGERGSFKGTDFSSVVRLVTGVASDQGIVKLGHKLITDDDDIQYNTIENLRLIGDDPFGTNGTHAGVDTLGLMCLNLGEFNENGDQPNGNGFVFFNQVHNILFEDVKEAYLLTSSVNAQMSTNLYFRRIGEFGIHCFGPLISDAAGTQYGQDWNALKATTTTTAVVASGTNVQIEVASTTGMTVGDAFTLVLSDAVVDSTLIVSVDSGLLVTVKVVAAPGANSGAAVTSARLQGSVAENSFHQMFVDGSFSDTTGIFPIMAFIRLEFRVATQQFTNVMDESGSNTVMTSAEGYNIDTSVRDCKIHGDFNILPAGTNTSLSTSIWDLSGVSRQRALRIDTLISDLLQVQLAGSAAVPWLFQVGSTSTGMYWPAADEIALSDTGVERYRFGGTVPHVFTGDVTIAGDTTLRRTVPVDDNNRDFGSLSLRWAEIFAANGTINTSDEREKTTFESMTEVEKSIALEIKSQLGKFKWNHAVEREEEGGKKARIHFGIGAQTVKSIIESHGLEPFDYSFLCYEEWEYQPEERKTPSEGDPEGELIRPAIEAGDRYGIRYEELLAFIISAL